MISLRPPRRGPMSIPDRSWKRPGRNKPGSDGSANIPIWYQPNLDRGFYWERFSPRLILRLMNRRRICAEVVPFAFKPAQPRPSWNPMSSMPDGAFPISRSNCGEIAVPSRAGLQERMGNKIFGCDDCLDVCPFNLRADPTRNRPFNRPF